MLRRGWVLSFAVALGVPAVTRAAPLADDAPHARVAIDTSALGDAAAPVAAQIDEGASTILETNGVRRVDVADAPQVQLKVSPLGEDKPGYLTEWVVLHDGETVDGTQGSRECSLCTESELVVDTQAAIEVVMGTLKDLGKVPAKAEPEPEPVVDDDPDQGDPSKTTTGTSDDEARPGRLTSLGKAGIAVAVVGGGALIPGIVLAVLPPKPVENANLRTTTLPGAVLAGCGGAALLTGVALVVVDVVKGKKKKNASTRFTPVVQPSFVGLGAHGRF